MKFKLDENLSPSLAALFAASGHDAHSVVEQALGGQPDDRIIDTCSREQRALVTLDRTHRRTIQASWCSGLAIKHTPR